MYVPLVSCRSICAPPSLYDTPVSVMANQVTGAKIGLSPEGPFPQHNVDMRKITGTGMCYVQAGRYTRHATCAKWAFFFARPEKNAAMSPWQYSIHSIRTCAKSVFLPCSKNSPMSPRRRIKASTPCSVGVLLLLLRRPWRSTAFYIVISRHPDPTSTWPLPYLCPAN